MQKLKNIFNNEKVSIAFQAVGLLATLYVAGGIIFVLIK